MRDKNLMTTSEVSKLLGVIVSVELLLDIGLMAEVRTGTGTYWKRSDFPLICLRVASHILGQGAEHHPNFRGFHG